MLVYVHVLEYYNFISSDVIFPSEIKRYIGSNTGRGTLHGVWLFISPFPSCQCVFTFCIDLNSKLPPFDQILNKLVPENAKCVYRLHLRSIYFYYEIHLKYWQDPDVSVKILTRPECIIWNTDKTRMHHLEYWQDPDVSFKIMTWPGCIF